MHTQIEL